MNKKHEAEQDCYNDVYLKKESEFIDLILINLTAAFKRESKTMNLHWQGNCGNWGLNEPKEVFNNWISWIRAFVSYWFESIIKADVKLWFKDKMPFVENKVAMHFGAEVAKIAFSSNFFFITTHCISYKAWE